MNGKELKQAIKEKKPVFGSCIISTSPEWMKHIKNIGFDYVFIDTEHIPIGREKLSWMCQGYNAHGLAPIVRIPSPDPYLASQAIDAGAKGVIAPYIETVDEVKALRGAVKLGRLKGKKLQDYLDGKTELEKDLLNYLTKENEEHLLLINIESVQSMAVLGDMLKVPQLDAVIIGPHDLSLSLGIPEQFDNPKFDKAIRTIIRKCKANNIGVGIHYSFGIEKEIQWAAEEELNIIMHSSDLNLFVENMRKDLNKIKDVFGERGKILKTNDINI